MTETNLSHADIVCVQIYLEQISSYAYLSGANLEGADLSNATFTDASYSKFTKWPKGSNPKNKGAVIVIEIKEEKNHDKEAFFFLYKIQTNRHT